MVRFRSVVALMLIVFFGIACGPKTVTPKYLLDTPSRHVATGMKFIDKEKWEAARLEFNRAAELDEAYAPAWVGLALVEAHEGKFEAADVLLNKAQGLYQTEDHRQFVVEGYRRVEALKMKQGQ
jgi:Flp pilus assembly protein TadD